MGFKCHALKAQWSMDYFIIELDGKGFCFLCSNTITTLKNICQHHEPKHSSKYAQLIGKQ